MNIDKIESAIKRIVGQTYLVKGKGEEVTKQALVLPMINALGYDVFNPAEVHPDRKDFLHKTSNSIAKNYDGVFVEDLNIKGMMKNHCLAKSISDVSWSEFNRQLEYKCKWSFKYYIKIGRFEPTSKTCSNCGCVKEMPLSKRVFACPDCGISIDRDLNAISKKFTNTDGQSGINACGDGLLEPSLKQEKECLENQAEATGLALWSVTQTHNKRKNRKIRLTYLFYTHVFLKKRKKMDTLEEQLRMVEKNPFDISKIKDPSIVVQYYVVGQLRKLKDLQCIKDFITHEDVISFLNDKISVMEIKIKEGLN